MHTALFICTANYYRSRFCEYLFNHLAAQSRLDWTAISRGVATELGAGNIGPISPYAIQGLQDRNVPLPVDFHDPIPLTEQDLNSADLVIVLDEEEHRPYMAMRFPAWADKVTYWHIGDLEVATSKEALALAEQNIRELIRQLSAHQRSGALVFSQQEIL
jgi:protein-tyrosine phosphatase